MQNAELIAINLRESPNLKLNHLKNERKTFVG